MTDGYALLRAIEASPEEDTPRLAYADWLEEHATSDADRARAEFIRVQCELASLPKDDPRVAGLNIRERDAVAPHCGKWARQFGVKLMGLRFERGFVTPVHTTATDFAVHAHQFVCVAPLTVLQLSSLGGERVIEHLAQTRFLRFVRHLDISGGGLSGNQLSRFALSPNFQQVTSLNLSHNNGNPQACAAFATCMLPALRNLSLARNPIGDAGLERLRAAVWFPNLHCLDVSTTAITDSGIVALAADPGVRHLRSLILADRSGRTWKDSTAQAILASPQLLQLQRLVFPVSGLTADTQAALRARFGTVWYPAEFSPD